MNCIKLDNGHKNASYKLNASIDYKITTRTGVSELKIIGLPYLWNVDRGRRAGSRRPPIQPIYEWIGYKRIKFNKKPYVKTVGNKKQTVTTRGVDQRRNMAYAIATNIAKRGIKPFPIFNVVNKVTASARFKQELAQSQAKDALTQIKFAQFNKKITFTK